MASFICERTDLFPDTTRVKSFVKGSWHPTQGGEPTGVKVGESEMSSGSATFTGLTEGLHYILYASVSGKDTYLEVSPAIATAPAAMISTPAPPINKLLGWSFDPANITSKKILLGASLLYLVRIPVVEPLTITNLWWLNVKAAVTATAGKCLAGIYNEAGKLVAEAKPSAVATAIELEALEAKVAMETPVAVAAGYVYAGMALAAGTLPELGISTAEVSAGVGLNIGALASPNMRTATGANAGTTALPATTGAQTAIKFLPWFGVS